MSTSSPAAAAPAKAVVMTSQSASLHLPDQTVQLPIREGSEGERAIDVLKLRAETGYITYDESYGNTGSCLSNITFIDGEKGILRYRGYPIEQIAQNANFLEAAYLIIWGELPTREQLDHFESLVAKYAYMHEGMRHHFQGFPPDSHPMAMLSSMINAASCYHPEVLSTRSGSDEQFIHAVARLLSKVRTVAASSYRMIRGEAINYPRQDLGYSENFLHLLFSMPHNDYVIEPEVAEALELIFTLHADHEQNCSTSTVRMVGSSGANLFASVSAGVCALWGPLHGGANMAVIRMLETIREQGMSVKEYIDRVKRKENGIKLMGFGHRVYKNLDPRARIIKESCDRVLKKLGKSDPLLAVAEELEQAALEDDYFVERKLYPNVDFYSGIIMRAIGLPINMFTVIFAIGRMPGWIANWKEARDNPSARIYRPRQIYTGPTKRDYVPMAQRG